MAFNRRTADADRSNCCGSLCRVRGGCPRDFHCWLSRSGFSSQALSPRRLPADTTCMEWQLVLVLALVLVALGNYLDIASEDGELVKSKGTRRSHRSRD